jgi:hypothetical protein
MGFLLREQREALLIEYNHLNEEMWERKFNTAVASAILTIGSLLVAFLPTVKEFPTPIASLVIVAIAVVLTATSDRIIAILCDRVEYLAKQLKVPGPKETYESKITGQWWYRVRRNVAYALYTILIGIYLFLIFADFIPLSIAIVAGFLCILIKEKIVHDKAKTKHTTNQSKGN